MTILYLLSATVGAVLFYLASPRQKLWPIEQINMLWLRISAGIFCLLSWCSAALTLGFWTGFYAALTALMLVLVALPFIDAYRSKTHVD